MDSEGTTSKRAKKAVITNESLHIHTVLQVANSLLQHAGIPRVLKTSRQCNSVLFVQLYEALTGLRVPGEAMLTPLA